MDDCPEYLDDLFAIEYEEVTHGAELFGINRNFAVQLALLREFKEFNRLFRNWSEGRR